MIGSYRKIVFALALSTLSCTIAQAQHNPGGWIQTRGWNLLFRLSSSEGCAPSEEVMSKNWVAPHDLTYEDPKAGFAWPDIDFGMGASALGYDFGNLFPQPTWVTSASMESAFSLGAGTVPNGDTVDLAGLVEYLNANVVPAQGGATPISSDFGLAIATTYVRNDTGEALEVEVCTSSDDSIQVRINTGGVASTSACRSVEQDCAETSCAVLPAGTSRITVLVWTGGGGWGFRLGLRLRGTSSNLADGNGSVTFLGPGGPAEAGQPFQPCGADACAAASCMLRGDANADGTVDSADAQFILVYLFQGDDSPPCIQAADADGNGTPDITDAIRLLNYLFLSGVPPVGNFLDCESAPVGCHYPAGRCNVPVTTVEPSFELGWSAPLVVEGAPGDTVTIPVKVRLTNPRHSTLPVQGWSLGVRARDAAACRIVNPTTDGTAGADAQFRSSLRTLGPGNEGAVSRVFFFDVDNLEGLPDNEGPHDLLSFGLEVDVPASGSTACILYLVDGLRVAGGLPGADLVVTNRIESNGHGFKPMASPLEVHVCPAITPVAPDGPAVAASLSPSAPSALFKIDPPPAAGKVVIVTLTDDDPADANTLSARWASPPHGSERDFASAEPQKTEQRIVIPAARSGGTYYLLIQRTAFDDGGNDVLLSVVQADVALERISTACGAGPCSGVVTIAAFGGGFDGATALELRGPGGELVPPVQPPSILSDSHAEAAFDLTGRSGLFDLVARKGKFEDRLPEAIRAAWSAPAASLDVSIRAPAFYRPGGVRGMTLRIANTGGMEADAPILAIEGPVEARLGLAEGGGGGVASRAPIDCAAGGGGGVTAAGTLRSGPLLLIAAPPGAPGGRLAPGAAGDVAVAFEADVSAASAPLVFRVLTLKPGVSELPWSGLVKPAGTSDAEWLDLVPRLEQAHGADSLAAFRAIASRLAHRGVRALELGDLFAFARAAALGEPTAAIVGTALGPDGGIIAGGRVVAVSGGIARACAVTDAEGRFALFPLADGAFEIVVDERRADPAEIVVSGGLDVLGARIVLRVDPQEVECPISPAPAAAPEPPQIPGHLLEEAASAVVAITDSHDPNKKEGPGDGLGVAPGEELSYLIQFENTPDPAHPETIGAARRVEVIDVLSPLVDLDTLVFQDVEIGGRLVSMSSGAGRVLTSGYAVSGAAERASPQLAVDICVPYPDPARPAALRVEGGATVDRASRTIRWVFETRDAYLGGEVLDDRVGFLPPSDATGRGAGHVSFSVQVTPDAGEMGEEEIENEATIVFDGKPVETNRTMNPVERPRGRFVRADANADGATDISDPVSILGVLFLGVGQLRCEKAADSNDDGRVDISDPVFILGFLFQGTVRAIPPPSPLCGVEPEGSRDELGCEDFGPCR